MQSKKKKNKSLSNRMLTLTRHIYAYSSNMKPLLCLIYKVQKVIPIQIEEQASVAKLYLRP